MPDWYVQKNEEDSKFPYSIRFGGCEYSLTQEQWFDFMEAMVTIDQSSSPICVESEGYQEINHNIARPNEVEEVRALLGLKPKAEVNIRRS